MKTALAIVAHPDDIEFRIAGTLLMLKQKGWEIHCFNIANGSLGSIQYTAAQTRRIRRKEAQHAAQIMGAFWHPPLVDDLEIFYDMKLIRRVAAVIREVRPAVIFTHPPIDYMEDHTNACRIAVTAAFVKSAPNFVTVPRRPHFDDPTVIYHCIPHGLSDTLRRPMLPDAFVNIAPVLETKSRALAAHQSQINWLEATQGIGAMDRAMRDEARKLGRLSGRYEYAEGWWRHLHLGFCPADADPLRDALGTDYFDKTAGHNPTTKTN